MADQANAAIARDALAVRPPPANATRAFNLLRRYHELNGVTKPVLTILDLFPSPWPLGRGNVPTNIPTRLATLFPTLPLITPVSKSGAEQTEIVGPDQPDPTVSFKTEWQPPVEVIAAILSAMKGQPVTRDDVLVVAQKSPEALEKLKDCGKVFKEHFTRQLNVIELRRDPRFNEVAARYRAQLRAMLSQQSELQIQVRTIQRQINDLLAERDEELHRLDPGYTPKRQSAAAVLRGFGIEIEEAAPGEGPVPVPRDVEDVLADLDF